MEPPILTNKNEFPTEEIIFSHIGKSKVLWQSVFEFIHATHPDLSEEWKYYNDGKSWLLKVVKKTKTVCWVSVLKNSFRMTFYFTDKAEQSILNSSISNELKEQFQNGKHYNKICGLTITFKYKKDVEYAKVLIALKLSLK
ncbi:MAG: DUF3788 family protein [Ignavibacteria bacterium]|nr:DUF3788 family protein [Ignavibacteria bacterium]